MLLAIVLSIVVIVGGTMLQNALAPAKPATPKPTPAAPAPNEPPPGMDGSAMTDAMSDGAMSDGAMTDASMDGMAGNPVPAPAPAPGGPPTKPTPEDVAAPVEGPEPTPFVVREGLEQGEWFEAGFTARGGALRSVSLRNSYEQPARRDADRKHLDLVLPVDPTLLTGMVQFGSDANKVPRTAVWTRDEAAEKATPATDVVFRLETKDGIRFTKRWVLPNEPDLFACDLELTATRASGAKEDEWLRVDLLGAAGIVREKPAELDPMGALNAVLWIPGTTDEIRVDPWRIGAVELSPTASRTRDFRFAGVETHYFALLLSADGSPSAPLVRSVRVNGGDSKDRDWRAADHALTRLYEEDRGRPLQTDALLSQRVTQASQNLHRAWATLDLKVSDEAKAAPTVVRVYAGPKSRHAFAHEKAAPVADLLTYPAAPDGLARLLLWIFDLWKGLTGSVGLAVILMTITVRGALMPLGIRNQLSLRQHGRKIARIKPKLEALKRKWGNDPRKFREEQVKLYRENGIGFPMGCLMLLLQAPIFFSLFSSLRVEFDLRNQSFLWIPDLANPDHLVDFGKTFHLLFFAASGINLLPLVMVALSLVQYRLMPKPTDPQQEQQMKMYKWMPIIFAVILYEYTAALSLYMVFSSLVALVESSIVRRKDARALAAEAA
jgi:YidC/Oxa1 family membrane protein insertase